MKKKIGLISVILTVLLFISCDDTKTNKNEETQKAETEKIVKKVVKKECKDVHWSHHKGADGPENWNNLCDGFANCGGSVQSPINIVTKNVVEGKELLAPKFKYGNSKVEIINNGHTVQFTVDKGNTVNLNGNDYELLQFHYHALSEHTIDDNYFPLEVHFVHKHSDTDYAVLGIMFVEGKENDLFTKYLDKFPTSIGEYKSDEMIDLLSLFPRNKNYYYYNGSLTTPPCSEIVSWYILEKPVELSKYQIEKFSKILNNNYRPVQPLNDREIKIFKE